MLRNWDQIKRDEAGREPGVFGEVPENLPAPLYARKVQRRAASSGFDFPGVERPLAVGPRRAGRARGRRHRDERFDELGDLLFAAVNVARKLRARSRAGAARGRRSIPRPGRGGDELAASDGRSWNDLAPDEQLAYYAASAA